MGGPWNLGAGRAVREDDDVVLDTWLAKRVEIDVGDTVDVLGRTWLPPLRRLKPRSPGWKR